MWHHNQNGQRSHAGSNITPLAYDHTYPVNNQQSQPFQGFLTAPQGTTSSNLTEQTDTMQLQDSMNVQYINGQSSSLAGYPGPSQYHSSTAVSSSIQEHAIHYQHQASAQLGPNSGAQFHSLIPQGPVDDLDERMARNIEILRRTSH